jgi:predicted TPR repeat methyltransferase
MADNGRQSLDQAYFDQLYARLPDPWEFETSDYERAKYEQTLATLSRPVYPSAFEVGCSIGVLTKRLAMRCERLLSVDIAEAALAKARARCATLTHVQFQKMAVPSQWPDARGFDLILLSEVIYYFNWADLMRLTERVAGSLNPKGECILVHWTEKTDYPLQGDEACQLFIDALGSAIPVVRHERFINYRIDVLQRL